jgi:hypothetical protein
MIRYLNRINESPCTIKVSSNLHKKKNEYNWTMSCSQQFNTR